MFVGGYFYDPFFGPYPWWVSTVYPHPYFPVFDDRGEIRLQVHQRDAAVYVDGYYAGVVDDFDGFFQRLPVTPGPHEVTLYLRGYHSLRQSLYIGPNSTYNLRASLEPLTPGEQEDPPVLAPPLPPPPAGTARLPRTYPGPVPAPGTMRAADFGSLAIRVQPDDAEVVIDGSRWNASDQGDAIVLQLASGTHRVEIIKSGFRRFVTDVIVRGGETSTLNVSLTADEIIRR